MKEGTELAHIMRGEKPHEVFKRFFLKKYSFTLPEFLQKVYDILNGLAKGFIAFYVLNIIFVRGSLAAYGFEKTIIFLLFILIIMLRAKEK